jgi:Rps23 Pro-64 3,4-dihydroxylase Tpa1-like proline 4-hydroxylase
LSLPSAIPIRLSAADDAIALRQRRQQDRETAFEASHAELSAARARLVEHQRALVDATVDWERRCGEASAEADRRARELDAETEQRAREAEAESERLRALSVQVSAHADRLCVQQQRADEDAASAQQRMSEAVELRAQLDERERALSATEADWRAAAAAWVAQRVRYSVALGRSAVSSIKTANHCSTKTASMQEQVS